MRKKGFTLIELLVVIAIIGLLATIAVIALQQSRARARDSKRVGDVKQMTTAMGLYQHDAGVYPATASVTPGAILSYNGVVYMAVVPTPPIPDDGCTGSTEYTYNLRALGANTAGSYTINYCLGSDTAGIGSGLNTATPAGIK